MEVSDYADIITELRNIRSLNINDCFFNHLSKKHKLSEETLRSIIGLWYQRKVAQTSFKVKEVDIFDFYKSLLHSGETKPCLKIAEKLEYPPSLIAKIVVTNYLAETKKNKTNSKESKNLRKQPCSSCKLLAKTVGSTKSSSKMDATSDDGSLVKRYDDPRIELALNLFDEDDEIGKYFLNKFTFSRNKTKKNELFNEKMDRNKSNKFFWQASTFEEMGEKNVKKFKDVAELFSNPNVSNSIDGLQNRLGQKCCTSENSPEPCVANQITKRLDNLSLSQKNCDQDSDQDQKFKYSEEKLKDLRINSSNRTCTAENNKSIEEMSSESTNNGGSCVDSTLDNENSIEPKTCSCISESDSENSDTDSADSDDIYDNLNVKELLENPSLIEDPVLAQDVFLCTLHDDQYGPTSDIIANSSGVSYERILEEYVKNVGLSYKTENKLRGVGVDKTPDIILLVPVAVNDFVINWIESKALFADYKLHQDFENNQFKNYINRFGPGLVIYWHGYTVDVRKSDLVNKQLIVEDAFPARENFTFVNSDKFKLWMQSTFISS